jgi:hypothetical protein
MTDPPTLLSTTIVVFVLHSRFLRIFYTSHTPKLWSRFHPRWGDNYQAEPQGPQVPSPCNCIPIPIESLFSYTFGIFKPTSVMLLETCKINFVTSRYPNTHCNSGQNEDFKYIWSSPILCSCCIARQQKDSRFFSREKKIQKKCPMASKFGI